MKSGTMTRYISGGRPGVDTTMQVIPIDKLRLDPRNVRFKHIYSKRKLSDKDIEELIWKESDTQSLYRLIVDSGGLTEKPFVDENNIVKEGNRRVVCLRQIVRDMKNGKIDPHVPIERFAKIECEVPVDSIAPLDMEILLARWHVKDKKPWAKLNQASHIYDLRRLRGLSYDDIAKKVGLSKGKVLQSCKSFEWTTEYMEHYNVTGVQCWSFFEELYKKKELREWVTKDRDNLETFFGWVYKKKFPMAIHVRQLPLILSNVDKQLARDLTEFFNRKEENIKSAIARLTPFDPSLNSDFFRSIKRLRKRLERMDDAQILEIRKMDGKKNALISLKEKIAEILKPR